MKTKDLFLGLAAAAVLAAGPVAAQSGEDVVKAKCQGCHDAAVKKVGPSQKDIAAKKPDVAATVAKLKDGKGHMKVAASEAELTSAMQHMLAAK